ncbi:HNH endonuclease, partial [Mycobacterium sp. pV006]
HAANNPAPTPNTFIYVVTDTTTLHTARESAQTVKQDQPAPTEPEPQPEAEAEAESGTEAGSASRAELRPQPAEEQSTPQAEVDADPAQDENETETETEDEDEDGAEDTTEPKPASPADSATASSPKAALIFGAGLVPAAGLHPLLSNARIREIIHPGDSPAEPRYLPSRALAEFIRCRDLTCRFPLCDIAATKADIDHTVPHPIGPTHASNLKCLCRFHHLLKTFWCGPDGWTDRQYPDGTIEWVSPTGHTYLTKPGSALLFPALCKPTATLWTNEPPPPPPTDQRRGIMMPRRRYTRAQAQTRYNQVLRRINEATPTDNGDELLPPPNDAPPF